MPQFYINLYIRFTSKHIYLTSATDKISDHIPARIALISRDDERVIVAVGNNVDGIPAWQQQNNVREPITVHEPFADPQTIVSDSRAASGLISFMMGRYLVLAGRNFFFAAWLRRIRLVIHPLERQTNNFTETDADELKRAAKTLHPKPSKIYVWVGRELSNVELATLQFPTDGRVFT